MKFWPNLVLAFFCCSASAALSDDLEQRERNATAIINDAGKAERHLAIFHTVTRNFFQGSHGILSMSKEWYTRSWTWMRELKSLEAIPEVSGPGSWNRSLSLFQNKLHILIREWQLLKELSENIEAKRRRALEILAKIEEIPGMDHGDFIPVATGFSETRFRFIAALSEPAFRKESRTKHMWSLLAGVERRIETRIKQQIIETALIPLDSSLTEFRHLLIWENRLMPAYRALQSLEHSILSSTLNFAWYTSEEWYEKSLVLCADFQNIVEGSDISDTMKNKAMRLSEKSCKATKQHFRSLESSGLSPAQMLAEYISLTRAPLEAECRKEQPSVNCEKLATILSQTRESLATRSEDRLKFIEKSWSQLEAGK